jgi:hypothetical protein
LRGDVHEIQDTDGRVRDDSLPFSYLQKIWFTKEFSISLFVDKGENQSYLAEG